MVILLEDTYQSESSRRLAARWVYRLRCQSIRTSKHLLSWQAFLSLLVCRNVTVPGCIVVVMPNWALSSAEGFTSDLLKVPLSSSADVVFQVSGQRFPFPLQHHTSLTSVSEARPSHLAFTTCEFQRFDGLTRPSEELSVTVYLQYTTAVVSEPCRDEMMSLKVSVAARHT
jgi:hypothetical protein